MKKLLSIIAFIGICGVNLFAAEYIVLIDYSKSISKADQKIYKKTLGSVLGKIKGGDRISLVNIGKNDVSNFSIFDEFSAKKGSTNKVKIYNKKSLTKLWKRFLDKPFETENNTKIISSIRGSVQRFNSSETDEKYLVILSDMIDSTKESHCYNFANAKGCNQITKVTQSVQTPNLTGIKVYIAGAGGQGDSGYRCLKNFWTEFFIKSGVNKSDILYQRINPFD